MSKIWSGIILVITAYLLWLFLQALTIHRGF